MYQNHIKQSIEIELGVDQKKKLGLSPTILIKSAGYKGRKLSSSVSYGRCISERFQYIPEFGILRLT